MTCSMAFFYHPWDSAGTHVALRLPHRAPRVRAGRLRNGERNGDGPRAISGPPVDPSRSLMPAGCGSKWKT